MRVTPELSAELSSLHRDTASLEVVWSDGGVTRYPWLWLRDHAHDQATMHPVTQQRQLDTAALPSDLRATTAVTVDGVTRLTWPGDDVSELPVEFLSRFRSPREATIATAAHPVVWDA